jgi:hypothetical protein
MTGNMIRGDKVYGDGFLSGLGVMDRKAASRLVLWREGLNCLSP